MVASVGTGSRALLPSCIVSCASVANRSKDSKNVSINYFEANVLSCSVHHNFSRCTVGVNIRSTTSLANSITFMSKMEGLENDLGSRSKHQRTRTYLGELVVLCWKSWPVGLPCFALPHILSSQRHAGTRESTCPPRFPTGQPCRFAASLMWALVWIVPLLLMSGIPSDG